MFKEPSPQSAASEQPFANTPEYRGRCRSYFQPRGQNEPGPVVTLRDGKSGQVVRYVSNLQNESYDFHPQIHIQIEGEESPRIVSLEDVEGFQGPSRSNLTREK